MPIQYRLLFISFSIILSSKVSYREYDFGAFCSIREKIYSTQSIWLYHAGNLRMECNDPDFYVYVISFFRFSRKVSDISLL